MTPNPGPNDASVSLRSAEPLFSPFGILKNVGSSLISLLSATLLGFLTSLILARRLDHEVYGLYVLMLGIAGILTALADLGLGQVAVREIARHRARTGSLIGSAMALRMAANAIVLLLAVIFLAVDDQMPGHEPFTLLVILTMIVSLTSDLLRNVFAGHERFELDLVTRLAERLAILTLVVLVAGMTIEMTVAVVLVGTLIGLSLTLAVTFYLVPFRAFRPSRRESRELLVAGLPLGLSILIVSFYSRYDVIILGALRTHSEVAWFSVAYSLIAIVISLSFAASSALLPVFSRLAHQGHRDTQFGLYRLALRYLLIVALALVGGIVVLAAPVVNAVYGASYAPAGDALQVLAFTLLFILPTHLMLAVLLSLDRQRLVLTSHLLSGLLLLVLDPLLISWMGVLGAAITNVLVEGIILAFCLSMVSRLLGRVSLGLLLRPAGAAIIALIVFLVASGLPDGLRLTLALVGYAGALFAVRAVTTQDMHQLRQALAHSRVQPPGLA